MQDGIAQRSDRQRITSQFRRNLDETLGDLLDPQVLHRRKQLLRGQLGGAGQGPAFERALDVAARTGLEVERAQQKYGAVYTAARKAQWRGEDMTADLDRADKERDEARERNESARARLEALARRDFRRRLARPWAPRRIRPVVRCTRGRVQARSRGRVQARSRRSHRVANPLKSSSGDSGDDGPAEPPGPGNPHTATIGGALGPPTEPIRDPRGRSGGR